MLRQCELWSQERNRRAASRKNIILVITGNFPHGQHEYGRNGALFNQTGIHYANAYALSVDMKATFGKPSIDT